jgi:hypothetical protein
MQEGKCYFCHAPFELALEKRGFHKDHLNPLANGGSNWPINLALVCRSCNESKGATREAAFWRVLEQRHGAEVIAPRLARAEALRPLRRRLSNARRAASKTTV